MDFRYTRKLDMHRLLTKLANVGSHQRLGPHAAEKCAAWRVLHAVQRQVGIEVMRGEVGETVAVLRAVATLSQGCCLHRLQKRMIAAASNWLLGAPENTEMSKTNYQFRNNWCQAWFVRVLSHEKLSL